MYQQKCEICNIDFESKRPIAKTCSDICRKDASRKYSANNIKVIDTKFDPIFDWKLCEELASKYNKPIDWVKRAIKSCRLAGETPQYIVDRYLEKNGVDINELVSEKMMDIVRGYELS